MKTSYSTKTIVMSTLNDYRMSKNTEKGLTQFTKALSLTTRNKGIITPFNKLISKIQKYGYTEKLRVQARESIIEAYQHIDKYFRDMKDVVDFIVPEEESHIDRIDERYCIGTVM